MDELEQVAFNLISNVGMAKSLIMEGLVEARNSNYDGSEAKLKEADTYLTEAHHAHFGLIQKEAQGEPTTVSLILMHAEDQLMTTEAMKDLVKEMILMYKKINQ